MKDNTIIRVEQPLSFQTLESTIRGEVAGWMQSILDEEVTEFLGRLKSQRRNAVDGGGYRNGYGKPRKLTLSSGTIDLRRPRVRGLEQRFVSRILPLFKRRTNEVSDLLPELYLHGLSCGDFDLALRGLLGEDAPISASTIARLKEKWHSQLGVWKSRSLDDLEGADGVYIKAGLEKDKSCLLVMIAALRLRTDAAKRFKRVDNARKTLLVAQSRFRKLNAPQLLEDVWKGVEFVDGVRKTQAEKTTDHNERAAA